MTKALPQGLDLTYDSRGLDTVRVAMTPSDGREVVDCITNQYGEDGIVVMLSGWLEECPGELRGDPERLQLLEAVAEAAQLYARTWRHRDGIGMTFSEYLTARGDYISDNWRAALEALAALEAHGEARTP